MTTITSQELNELKQANRSLTLLDVRTPAEFREVHVEFARNAPLERLDTQEVAREFSQHANGQLYVICQSGGRSKQACERLEQAGLKVINVSGGMQAWA